MDLVAQLAELVGFHASYTGTFGDNIIAKPQAQKSLLSAMGYQLDDDSLKQSIVQLSNNKYLSTLPAVHIANDEDEQRVITISLPKTDSALLNWKIITEELDEKNDECNVSDLHFIDEETINGITYARYLLPLPKLAQGYHELAVTFDSKVVSCPYIVAPKTCYSHKQISKEKMWGYTAQLYSLTSINNWGIGDFSDLKTLTNSAAQLGASTIGINPLHPLYQANPAHRSPYSPSARCFLNALYIDVTAVPNFSKCTEAQKVVNDPSFQQQLIQAKAATLIDYPTVANIKYPILTLLFEDFCANAGSLYTKEAQEFDVFKQRHGQDLQKLATFEALYEYFHMGDENVFGWTDWPKEFQDPDSDEVSEFIRKNANRIEYFCFVQWCAHHQLNEVSELTKTSNMKVGLYLDLAVGCDGSGAEVWSDQNLYIANASIGAPPDDMNPLGQDWGLTPMNPNMLQKQGYQPLVKALRSNMQYAGALRIDHILGLMRQYWVAPGMAADEGVYISFPLDDILRIIALESQRNSCIVIGEDLGNVPDGFRDIMREAGLLSFKVMFFERWESGLFKRPELFPEQSVVTISTHDTATLSGWWQGQDLVWRQQLALYPNEEAGEADRNARSYDRQRLIDALLDLNVIDNTNLPQQSPAVMDQELSTAVQKYLASAPSHIQLIPLEEALMLSEQVNIPGTIDQHPNWLQKLPVYVEDIGNTASVINIASEVNKIRP